EVHRPSREDRDARRRRRHRGTRTRPRRRLCRHVHAVHGRARFRRRAHGREAEPRVVLPRGARVEGQTGPPGVASRAHVRDRNRRRARMRRIRRGHVLTAAVALALSIPASGASTGSSAGALPTKIGKGEGHLNLIEWPAYSDPSFANKFVKQTGCKIKRTDAGTSNDMVALMRTGGGRGGGQDELGS